MRITAVIMAGGKGERFWPKSRESRPKQFLSLTSDGETMIQKTIKRISSLVNIDDIFVITNKKYLELIDEQLPELPKENVIAEPAARNTAPCIGLAAEFIRRRYKEDVIMLSLPSDHLIKFDAMFVNTLRQAAAAAEINQNLITIGITPTYPETGYGYINFSSAQTDIPGIYKVIRFVEKPDIEHAKSYLNSGEYLWNSGMFVWKTSSILNRFEQLLPEMYEAIVRIGGSCGTPEFESVLDEIFPTLQSISIDFGIMEHAENIYTIPGNFGWDDVGSWLALERINTTNEYGNYVRGDVVSIDTKNTIVMGSKRLIATIGVENLVIVDSGDAVLICSKDETQDVKRVIDNLKICNRSELI